MPSNMPGLSYKESSFGLDGQDCTQRSGSPSEVTAMRKPSILLNLALG